MLSKEVDMYCPYCGEELSWIDTRKQDQNQESKGIAGCGRIFKCNNKSCEAYNKYYYQFL